MTVPFGVCTVSEQMHLPLRIARDNLDIYHATTSLTVPMIRPCKLVVTLHDLLLKIYPQYLPSISGSLYFNIINWWAIKSADKIITVSKFTENELVSRYPKSKQKVMTIHNGVSKEFQPIHDHEVVNNVKKRYGIKKGYILYVGTYKQHKNLEALVNAYARLPIQIRNDYNLLIAGKQDKRYPEVPALVKQLGLEDSVICVNYINEKDLPALYSGATVFVLPSLYEGFGLPVIEAMACGVPVVASKIPSLLEITAGSAILVDPQDIQEMADAICRVITRKETSFILKEKGLCRAKEFSWFTTAKKVIEVYESIL
jgi:alpha-1,3-rhamnosyl/mannosyltransferase